MKRTLRLACVLWTVACTKTSTAPEQRWETVKWDDVQFDFPTNMRSGKEKLESDGHSASTMAWESVTAEAGYTVALVDYPPRDVQGVTPEEALDGARKTFFEDGEVEKETVVSLRSSVTHLPISGRALEVTDRQGMHIRARFYWSGNRLYQVMAVYAQRPTDTARFQRIVDSFVLTK